MRRTSRNPCEATITTKLIGMPSSPQQEWACPGGQDTAAADGAKGVFIETAKADSNQLFAALDGSR